MQITQKIPLIYNPAEKIILVFLEFKSQTLVFLLPIHQKIISFYC